jgi:hypothetical protein
LVYSLVLNGRITVNVFDSEYDGISSFSDSKLSLVNFWSTHCIYFSRRAFLLIQNLLDTTTARTSFGEM